MPRGKCSCGKWACFNVIGETIGVCCVKCKTIEMIDIVNKKCSCGTQPRFNFPNETIGAYCQKCKLDGMINVVDKKCPCGKQPSFNFSSKTIGICCKSCKLDGMIEVVNRKCICGKRPSLNFPGEEIAVCCKSCKTLGMINVNDKKCSCGKIPIFGSPGDKIAVCCKLCKTEEMINIKNKICPGYGGIVCPISTQLYNGFSFCISCDPNDVRRKKYKRFEETFFDYIQDKLEVHKREFRVSFDPNETSKKFAKLDGVVFGDDVIICLEVDENGHQNYDCDEHRMHLVTAELLQKYASHMISWVRVNPTIDARSQWSKKSKAIREKRFEDAVNCVHDILKNRETRIVYIGFD